MSEDSIFTRLSGLTTGFMAKKKPAGPVPPHLVEPSRQPHGSFHCRIKMTRDMPYEVTASADLKTWEPLARGTASRDVIDVVDAEAPKHTHRFYRAVSQDLPSPNVVGYVTIVIPPGFSMIANPLDAAGNAVAALFPNMPEGTTLSKYDTKMFQLANNLVTDGTWQHPKDTLAPGEGAILFNPLNESMMLHFVGEVMQGHLLNSIPAGFSIRSSIVPQPGRLEGELEFPLTDGDVIHVFDRRKQQYVIYNYPSTEWETSAPVIAVGESFWVGKTAPGNWARNFRVGQEEKTT